ncbi:hypothetical protein T492DRAFT_857660 [Pavlovales sp. CCMP2436]|nr:hypothetical protein T492DRAFT_857660 [Pavlovales sp. CCMP2436]
MAMVCMGSCVFTIDSTFAFWERTAPPPAPGATMLPWGELGSPLSLLERASSALQDLGSDVEKTMSVNATPQREPPASPYATPVSVRSAPQLSPHSADSAHRGDEQDAELQAQNTKLKALLKQVSDSRHQLQAELERLRTDADLKDAELEQARGLAEAAAAHAHRSESNGDTSSTGTVAAGIATAEAAAAAERARELEAGNAKLRALLHKLNEANKLLKSERAANLSKLAQVDEDATAARRAAAELGAHADALQAQLDSLQAEVAAAASVSSAAAGRGEEEAVQAAEARARADVQSAELAQSQQTVAQCLL